MEGERICAPFRLLHNLGHHLCKKPHCRFFVFFLAAALPKFISAINEPETFRPTRAYPQTVCTAMAPEPLLKSTFEAYAPEYLGTQRGTITKVCPFPSADYWRQRPVIFPSCAVSGSGASLPASLWGVLCCLEGIKGIIGRESAWCLAWSCRGGLSPGWEDEG